MYPIFLSSGKTANFQHKKLLIQKISAVLDSGQIKESDIFCLYLGEPDMRYQLGYKWYPHYNNIKQKKLRIVDSKVDKIYIENTISKYLELLEQINKKFNRFIHVISPTGSYPSALKALLYFNKRMKEETLNLNYVSYIDIISDTIKDRKVDPRFIPKEGLKADPIHLNSKVSDILIDELINLQAKAFDRQICLD
jgi:hypothetical protein